MKNEIINNLNNPRQLEKLYRDNKRTFNREFNSVYPEIKDNPIAQIWNERLNFDHAEISWGTKNEIVVVIVLAIIAALIAKIPEMAGISPDYFYPRNISFIVFPFLIFYFAWKQKIQIGKIIVVSITLLVSVIYINLLPDNDTSDTFVLACIHLPLLLWAALGYTFVGYHYQDMSRRLDFLRYNGDLLVMTAIILISGGLLSGITMGLFELINIKIENFYADYIITCGLAAVPIVGTYLVQTNPHLVNKVSPVIAKIFSPLVLITLVIYLIAIIYSGKDPYNDREFLLIFNVLLIGVMALILFSIAETSKKSDNKIETLILLALSLVTVIVNGIALSAIVFRISEWGVTPNRIAVLGGNVLILINLLLVTYRLFKSLQNRNEIIKVENTIASFLPVYTVWTIIVTFIFPIVFNFK